LKIILMGPPGAGKGTQAVRIADHFGIPHISTGDMFRAAVKSGTEMGKKAKFFMDQGLLVPDEVTIGVVRERLAQPDCAKGFLLDGFPRTLAQAEALDRTLQENPVDVALNIEVPREELIRRLTGRRVCRACGATYHRDSQPSQVEGVCDACGGELYQRDDDGFDTVTNRLEVYSRQTEPLVAYYGAQNKLVTVTGTKPVTEVFSEIIDHLQKWQSR
jgi:adenylate kinase